MLEILSLSSRLSEMLCKTWALANISAETVNKYIVEKFTGSLLYICKTKCIEPHVLSEDNVNVSCG